MTSVADTFVGVSADLLQEFPEMTIEQVAEDVLNYLSSDEGCVEVVRRMKLPTDFALRMAELKARRLSSRSSKKQIETVELARQFVNFQKSLNGLVVDGTNQSNGKAIERLSVNTVYSQGEYQFALHTTSSAGNPLLQNDRESIKAGFNRLENSGILHGINRIVLACEEKIESGEHINNLVLGNIGANLDLISRSSYYSRRIFDVLMRDYSSRGDKGPMKFVDLLPRNEKPSKIKGSRSEPNKIRHQIEKLLMKLISAGTSDSIDSLVDSYIKGEIPYNKYIEGVSEVSRYASKQWPIKQD